MNYYCNVQGTTAWATRLISLTSHATLGTTVRTAPLDLTSSRAQPELSTPTHSRRTSQLARVARQGGIVSETETRCLMLSAVKDGTAVEALRNPCRPTWQREENVTLVHSVRKAAMRPCPALPGSTAVQADFPM